MITLRVPLAIGLQRVSRWAGNPAVAWIDSECARILMFHGTPPQQARELARQLHYLASQFEIVPLESLIGELRSPGPRLRRKLALTFDDGLRTNMTVAYPLLKAMRLPASFFICPGLIESGGWLWNHEARQRLYSLPPAALEALAGELGAPAATEAFIEWMKRLKLGARKRVEQRVREATPGFAPTRRQHEQFDLAGWNDLRQLDPRFVAVGSHSLTHTILTSLNPNEVEIETRESRRLIEERLGRPAETFCYPNGDVDDTVLRCVRNHYSAAVGVEPGWVKPGCNLYLLPRWAPPRGVLRLAWTVHP